jgi:hypothetical protein
MRLGDLQQDLERERKEALEEAKRIETSALSSFETDLQQQCSTAASTLKSALEESQTELLEGIRTYNSELKTALSGDSKELTDQLATLKVEVAKWTPRLTLAVKLGVFLPIAVTLFACGLMIFGTWWWMPRELWNLRTSHQTMKDGRSYLVIDDPTWTNCDFADKPKKNIADEKAQYIRPCKTIEPPNPNQ